MSSAMEKSKSLWPSITTGRTDRKPCIPGMSPKFSPRSSESLPVAVADAPSSPSEDPAPAWPLPLWPELHGAALWTVGAVPGCKCRGEPVPRETPSLKVGTDAPRAARAPCLPGPFPPPPGVEPRELLRLVSERGDGKDMPSIPLRCVAGSFARAGPASDIAGSFRWAMSASDGVDAAFVPSIPRPDPSILGSLFLFFIVPCSSFVGVSIVLGIGDV
mmetsp:Transcript_4399/g.8301  ORF Transcript_4399/g.8301 Transcript_4399/m.8301 type:complete len:217 (-) Transcript_4399:230-880(-)